MNNQFNIQSIFFLKNKFSLNSSTDCLIKNNLGNFKRINEDKYYYRFTYQSRLKLQEQNYIRQVEYFDNNNIKIEHYTKLEISPSFIIDLTN